MNVRRPREARAAAVVRVWCLRAALARRRLVEPRPPCDDANVKENTDSVYMAIIAVAEVAYCARNIPDQAQLVRGSFAAFCGGSTGVRVEADDNQSCFHAQLVKVYTVVRKVSQRFRLRRLRLRRTGAVFWARRFSHITSRLARSTSMTGDTNSRPLHERDRYEERAASG